MRNLISRLKDFSSDTRASLSVEAVLAFPLLVWAMTATYTYYDAYRAQNATYRANYTIADMISRETSSVDANYMDGLFSVFKYMTNADSSSDTWMRVSIIHCVSGCTDKVNRNLDLDWSYGANGTQPLNDTDFSLFEPLTPLLAQGDRLILVETSLRYTPPFENLVINFPSRDLVSHSVTRPRFAPQLAWDNTYDLTSGGNHSDNSEDWTVYDDDPDLPPDV